MYPHEFSGGMRQRVMIAMALITKPDLLIADEPTTALDVTVQAQILELMKKMRSELGMAVILISHDLGVVSGFCDRAMVMYAGRVMETAKTEDLFYQTEHPYTQALQKSIPALHAKGTELYTIRGAPPDPLHTLGRAAPSRRGAICRGILSAQEEIDCEGSCARPRLRLFARAKGESCVMTPPRAVSCKLKISKTHFAVEKGFLFKRRIGSVRAVDGVSLELRKGEILGLVGETGCGKSTLGRTILQLIPPTAGTVILQGPESDRLAGQ